MVHHIEKHSSDKLFDQNDMAFLNATGKLITLLIGRDFDRYRTILRSKKILENWKVFEIRDAFVACGQLFQLCPAERPVMKHYVLV